MVPFCWQIAPAGGGQTGWAPSMQVGVHAAADVVVDTMAAGWQVEGVTVTVTVPQDAGQVFVAVVEVAHVLEEDLTEVQDDVGVAHVVADDLTRLLCEVVLPGDVDDAVLLGTLIVVLQYISPTTHHSFSVNVTLPMLVSPQCRCCNTVSIKSIKVAKSTYHACEMTVSSQLDRLDNTVHKELPVGHVEVVGSL